MVRPEPGGLAGGPCRVQPALLAPPRPGPAPPLPRKPLAAQPCGAAQLHDTALQPAAVTQRKQLSGDRIGNLCLGPAWTPPAEGPSETQLRSRRSAERPRPAPAAQARAGTACGHGPTSTLTAFPPWTVRLDRPEPWLRPARKEPTAGHPQLHCCFGPRNAATQ